MVRRHFSSAVTVQHESLLRKGVGTRMSGRLEIALDMPIRVFKEYVQHGNMKNKDELAPFERETLIHQIIMVA